MLLIEKLATPKYIDKFSYTNPYFRTIENSENNVFAIDLNEQDYEFYHLFPLKIMRNKYGLFSMLIDLLWEHFKINFIDMDNVINEDFYFTLTSNKNNKSFYMILYTQIPRDIDSSLFEYMSLMKDTMELFMTHYNKKFLEIGQNIKKRKIKNELDLGNEIFGKEFISYFKKNHRLFMLLNEINF